MGTFLPERRSRLPALPLRESTTSLLDALPLRCLSAECEVGEGSAATCSRGAASGKRNSPSPGVPREARPATLSHEGEGNIGLTRGGLYRVTRPQKRLTAWQIASLLKRAGPNGKFAHTSRRRQRLPRRSQRHERAGQDRLARLSRASHLCDRDARLRQPQGSAAQQPGQAADHQCGHPARRLLSIRAGDAVAGLSVAAGAARHRGAEISPLHRRHRALGARDRNRAPRPRARACLRLLADPGGPASRTASPS